MKTLHDINEEGKALYGESPSSFTDKGADTGHTYITLYEEKLAKYRDSVNMLEIGVSSGGSLWLWRRYFKDYKITALDILPTWCVKRDFQKEIALDNNINIQWNMDSNNVNTWLDIEPEQFNIIIDDGDHWIDSQILNFEHAWPKLALGGLYIIEDVVNEQFLPRLEDTIAKYPNASVEIYKGRIDTRPDDIVVLVTKV